MIKVVELLCLKEKHLGRPFVSVCVFILFCVCPDDVY
jgi:hypothetical protein